ncbi:excinuclease ABC subunit UvrA [Clostridium cylindrosporum]|uniref:UvrABC system protein A n=1 Tax=Clostridium cylindrosporum DSM 605 TaxID=1121307 RepID=A0A0J8D9X5_CLOCY|nr:excinuclease ABC subunit UvrA [Clostridium cylindrosporum]KMT21093.1 UvrABC system protein A [Clostridium cylindrosporum DSM 605]
MERDKIIIKGARENNLKNIDIEIPRNKFVVLTGLSGSGKSSLAFDTIYAEGQRRYVESLSAYARQFLGQMDKPDVDYIEGLSPAISIDQKTTNKNPRSTVGTVTEIYDYLRLLYARVGTVYCPSCGKEIEKQSVDQMVDKIMTFPERTKLQVLAPVIRGRKGEHAKLLEKIKKDGFVRVRIDGEIHELEEEIKLQKNIKHNIEIIVDRLIIKEGIEGRLSDSIETSLKLAEGLVIIQEIDGEESLFSENFACPDCNLSIEEITPRMFSFNSPFGKCEKCDGLGNLMEISRELVLDTTLSINQGAIKSWKNLKEESWSRSLVEGLSNKYDFDLDTPLEELGEDIIDLILYGNRGEKFQVNFVRDGEKSTIMYHFEGLIPNLKRRYLETASDYMRGEIESYMSDKKCSKCKGARLRPESLSVKIGGLSIDKVCSMPIREEIKFFQSLDLSDKNKKISEQILKEIKERLSFLADVGLDYLDLSRAASTLSGGESQRIRLATQIGSSLVGVLYILDEPSIGLHQRDNDRLLATLKNLRDIGNTLIVVEHDEDTMREADYIIDIGPGAGAHGGEIMAKGTPEEIMLNENSLTGQYLSGRKKIEVPEERRKAENEYIEIKGAKENNLKNVNVKLPIGLFTCVTGVSGSGKSTLVNDILYKGAAKKINRIKDNPGIHKEILGLEYIDKVVDIDQSPIGRTPRSNSATYTGVFDSIREIFSQTSESKMKGYKPGRFSFNVKGGRCEACSGDGIIKIEMQFLSDVYIPCEVCKGSRYNRETLEVKYKGKTISDVLNMTIEEALEFFENIPKIKNKLQTLNDVGLSYIKLGQPSTQLSGGEAQRVKLATELSKRSTGKTLYILDEPTTGLHIEDVSRLIGIIQRLAQGGNTVVIIEHNLDVIKCADYLVDLGPEGGDKGGEIVAYGTPEEVSKSEKSYTAKYLRKIL